MNILAIDPGPTQSAFVLFDGERIVRHLKSDNAMLCDAIMTRCLDADEMVIEKIASYGMPVGAEVFETVFWSGRFAQAFYAHLKPVYRIERLKVKMHLCRDSRAKDGNIRQSLIDRFGPPGAKKAPGVLYGISGDVWAALAVAVTWWDQHAKRSAA